MRSVFTIRKSGQTMIEVVVAVGVAVLLAVSLITTTLVTQRTARTARNNTQATKLAQETIEQIRIYRDRQGFASMQSLGGNCYVLDTVSSDPENWTLASCTTPEQKLFNNVTFSRNLAIVPPPLADCPAPCPKLNVTVTVSWTDQSGLQKVVSSTTLTKWEQ